MTGEKFTANKLEINQQHQRYSEIPYLIHKKCYDHSL